MGRLARAVSLAAFLVVCSSLPATAVGPVNSSVSGHLAAGGPFFRDSAGRAVLLRGVNAVPKLAPYSFGESGTLSLTEADAARMESFGFNVVRLGIIWKGLEPGQHGRHANDPAICTPVTGAGQFVDAGEYQQSVVDAYLAAVDRVVNLLAAHRIYTLVDMHQDVYNERYGGEGAPDWAVCDAPFQPQNQGPWNAHYVDPAVGAAFNHFWNNDVRGDLLGEYDRVWSAVAQHFKPNPWVVGYDLFNEPFSTEVYSAGGAAEFDQRLKCVYTGIAGTCLPNQVPSRGIIPSIQSTGSTQLLFFEPDVSADFGNPSYFGPMPFPNLVLNFHDYCLVAGTFGNTTDTPDCNLTEPGTFQNKAGERAASASEAQPSGPGWFLSEFGAEENENDIARMTRLADESLISWTYWAWREYHDPTGATGANTEALVNDDLTPRHKTPVLVRTYPRAVAGTPTRMTFSPDTGSFHLEYVADSNIQAPTEIFVPVAMHYPCGYTTSVSGAVVTSAANSTSLVLENQTSAGRVTVEVQAASCASGQPAATSASQNAAGGATAMPFTATPGVSPRVAGALLATGLLIGLSCLFLARRTA